MRVKKIGRRIKRASVWVLGEFAALTLSALVAWFEWIGFSSSTFILALLE